MLTGSARLVQEAKDQAQAVADRQASQRKQRELEQEQANLRGQADAIAKRLAGIGAELQIANRLDTQRQQATAKERQVLAQARKAD